MPSLLLASDNTDKPINHNKSPKPNHPQNGQNIKNLQERSRFLTRTSLYTPHPNFYPQLIILSFMCPNIISSRSLHIQ